MSEICRDVSLARWRSARDAGAGRDCACAERGRHLGRVIDEIRAFDPGFQIVVVDDGSTDRTARSPPQGSLRRSASVQSRHRQRGPDRLPVRIENDFDVAVQIDGDCQHDPSELPAILGPVLDGLADVVIGSRFAGAGVYRAELTRRFGIRLFARVVSAIVGSAPDGHQLLVPGRQSSWHRRVRADYPHGYLERSRRPSWPRSTGSACRRCR